MTRVGINVDNAAAGSKIKQAAVIISLHIVQITLYRSINTTSLMLTSWFADAQCIGRYLNYLLSFTKFLIM